MEWDIVYSLARDEDRIRTMQQATLSERKEIGLSPTPALVGSSRWWQLLGSPELPSIDVEGTISSVLWTGMGDWAEFELTQDDGTKHSWTRNGDHTRYSEGLRAQISYALVRFKNPSIGMPDPHPLVLETRVEKSRLRSCDFGPGPGRNAYRELTTLHGLVSPSQLGMIERFDYEKMPQALLTDRLFYVSEEVSAASTTSRSSPLGVAGFLVQIHVETMWLSTRQAVAGELGLGYRFEDEHPFNSNLRYRIDVIAEVSSPQSSR